MLQKKPLIVFHFWKFQKQQQEDITVSPQYWARAATSKVVERQTSLLDFPKIRKQTQYEGEVLR